VLTATNLLLSCLPAALTLESTASEMQATNNPYSIDVEPDSSERKRRNKFFMALDLLLDRQSPRKGNANSRPSLFRSLGG
jgi:hypothetical protein